VAVVNIKYFDINNEKVTDYVVRGIMFGRRIYEEHSYKKEVFTPEILIAQAKRAINNSYIHLDVVEIASKIGGLSTAEISNLLRNAAKDTLYAVSLIRTVADNLKLDITFYKHSEISLMRKNIQEGIVAKEEIDRWRKDVEAAIEDISATASGSSSLFSVALGVIAACICTNELVANASKHIKAIAGVSISLIASETVANWLDIITRPGVVDWLLVNPLNIVTSLADIFVLGGIALSPFPLALYAAGMTKRKIAKTAVFRKVFLRWRSSSSIKNREKIKEFMKNQFEALYKQTGNIDGPAIYVLIDIVATEFGIDTTVSRRGRAYDKRYAELEDIAYEALAEVVGIEMKDGTSSPLGHMYVRTSSPVSRNYLAVDVTTFELIVELAAFKRGVKVEDIFDYIRELLKDKTVLDLGCGREFNLVKYLKGLGIKKVIGLDRDLPYYNPEEGLIKADAHSLAEELRKNGVDKVDVVISIAMLNSECEYVLYDLDRRHVIQEIKKILPEDGEVYISSGPSRDAALERMFKDEGFEVEHLLGGTYYMRRGQKVSSAIHSLQEVIDSAASSSSISAEDYIKNKYMQLIKILKARGYKIKSGQDLSECLKKEIRIQEDIFGKREISIVVGDRFSKFIVKRQMPSPEDLKENKPLTVSTLENGNVLVEGKTEAKLAFAQFIRWILWEKGFHGKNKAVSFDTNDLNYYTAINQFKEGPLVDLTAYLKTLIREALRKQNKYDKGLVLLETERALNLIADWFLENNQGTDYGVRLLALYVGIPGRDRKHYIKALSEHKEDKASSALKQKETRYNNLGTQFSKIERLLINLRLKRSKTLVDIDSMVELFPKISNFFSQYFNFVIESTNFRRNSFIKIIYFVIQPFKLLFKFTSYTFNLFIQSFNLRRKSSEFGNNQVLNYLLNIGSHSKQTITYLRKFVKIAWVTSASSPAENNSVNNPLKNRKITASSTIKDNLSNKFVEFIKKTGLNKASPRKWLVSDVRIRINTSNQTSSSGLTRRGFIKITLLFAGLGIFTPQEVLSIISKLSSQDLSLYVKFFLEQKGFYNLIPSHYPSIGESKFSQHYPYRYYAAYTYDMAIYAIVLNLLGFKKQAEEVLDIYAQISNLHTYQSQPNYHPTGGIFHSIRVLERTGTWWPKWDWGVFVGPMAWIGMASLIVNPDKYKRLATYIADWIIQLQAKTVVLEWVPKVNGIKKV
jgi:SAM-dependent methyltransferase